MKNCRCGKPVDLSEPHVTYVRHVEKLKRNKITVMDAETVERRHVNCDR